VVSPALLDLARARAASPDRGRGFFLELAAKQIAVYKGLGYRGAYLGGVHGFETVERVLAIERTFAPDDWRQFAKDIAFSRPGEFFFYGKDDATGLADDRRRGGQATTRSRHVGPVYRFSKWMHHVMFEPDRPLARWGARVTARARDPRQGPPALRAIEHASKAALFSCKDCGDCSLPEIGFLCPESQCAKNQRNGPCGGTRDGRCEVDGFGDCIWLRAYERLQHDGREAHLLDHAPVTQDQGLRGTSSWANTWLGRDHIARPALDPGARTEPAPGAASTDHTQPTPIK
jgi:methylenetetrahydrofolate reductase (NADPH)